MFFNISEKLNKALTALDTEAQLNNAIRTHNNRPGAAANHEAEKTAFKNMIALSNEKTFDLSGVFSQYKKKQIEEQEHRARINEAAEKREKENKTAFIKSINEQIKETRPKSFNISFSEIAENGQISTETNDTAAVTFFNSDHATQKLLNNFRDNYYHG